MVVDLLTCSLARWSASCLVEIVIARITCVVRHRRELEGQERKKFSMRIALIDPGQRDYPWHVYAGGSAYLEFSDDRGVVTTTETGRSQNGRRREDLTTSTLSFRGR